MNKRVNWKLRETQRSFLDLLASKLKIKNPQEWGKITLKIIIESGGNSLLKQHKSSLKKALQFAFPEIIWQDNWFSNVASHKRGYWKIKENQKKCLESIAKKLNIVESKDWGKITNIEIINNGGGNVLKQYRGSLFGALESVFNEIKWNREWFSNIFSSTGFWKVKENQRKFLEDLSKHLNIRSPKDWAVITQTELSKHGGSTLLREYNGSLFQLMSTLFPEIHWKEEWFHKEGFWTKSNNQREFCDKIAKNLGIKEPKDWGSISNLKFIKLGGNTILSYYEGSLFRTLSQLYPDVNWKREWFANAPNTWNASSTRFFLDELARKYNIKVPSDWRNITRKNLIENGGSGILKYYRGSLINALQETYPGTSLLWSHRIETGWKQEWFKHPDGYWKNKMNRRAFFDKIAKKFQIKVPKDWGNITRRQVMMNGGSGLLKYHFGDSLINALHQVYPGDVCDEVYNLMKEEIKWRRSWFTYVPKYPSSFWNTPSNQRAFLDELMREYNLCGLADWKRVSLALIKKKGGQGLLERYNFSLTTMLRSIYPNLFGEINMNDLISEPHQAVLNVTKTMLPRFINL